MLYASEQTQANGHPVHVEAVRRLRHEKAAGATALRGIWGYHGDHPPHGDSFWSLRRRVPDGHRGGRYPCEDCALA